MENPMKKKSIEFSKSILLYTRWLRKDKKEYSLSDQLLRSATSIGANIHEAYGTATIEDFIAKLHISLKEANETKYWLVVLENTEFDNHEISTYKIQVTELQALLTKTIKTAKETSGKNYQTKESMQ